MRLALILGLECLCVAIVRAQSATVVDTIAEARRLRDAKDFAGAAALMRPYVEAHPDDPGSARFAALLSYWANRRASADSIYSRALSAHPRDVALRLEYGQFLVETKNPRAVAVLEPVITADSLAASPNDRARAQTLMGTAAYWRGDFTAARREFLTALALDSTMADARRQLREIETASAPWVRFTADAADDDQPLRRAAFDAEGAWFANPLTSLGVRARSSVFDLASTTESVLAAEVNYTTYVPAAHLDLSGGAGVLARSFDRSNDATGHAALGIRLPARTSIVARYDRSPYSSTVRSLGQAIMVQTAEGGVRWGTAPGWLGEIAGRREIYPDDNHVSTAFGWTLVPLVRHAEGSLQVGYGFSASSAERSRFNPVGRLSVRPGQPPATVEGEYNPYYTPRNLRVHSALANARVSGSRWSLEASGRYAISAHDEAPILLVVASPPTSIVTRDFYDRSFSPWNARARLDCAATPSVRIGLGIEHGKEAFYSYTSARAQLTYTFLPAAQKRAAFR